MKFGDKGNEPVQNIGVTSMAVSSLKNAMNHVRSEGIEKKNDRKVIHLTMHLIYIYMYDYSFVLYTLLLIY